MCVCEVGEDDTLVRLEVGVRLAKHCEGRVFVRYKCEKCGVRRMCVCEGDSLCKYVCIRQEVDRFKSVNQGHVHTSTVQVHEVWSEEGVC